MVAGIQHTSEEAHAGARANLPTVIQGGMGVAVSNWRLANAVASYGQLGVVSGTGIDTVLVRRLQDGDPAGHTRRALEHFPFPEVAKELLRRYFRPDGRPDGKAYARVPMATHVDGSPLKRAVTVAANFVEVFLAKEGHDGPVGINLLTKIQLPNLASLYGAMLAKVDYVLMGAGIPREIPQALDTLSQHLKASMKVDLVGKLDSGPLMTTLDPAEWDGASLGALPRPAFLPIISTHALGNVMLKRATGSIEGFVVEYPIAGGHNAPPRGGGSLDERGQPVYGERDEVDLEAMRALGVPFWLAGGSGSPERVRAALDAGATGVQVGTAFAYSDESGLAPDLKRSVIDQAIKGTTDVLTDARASPTGYPFKVVTLSGTHSDEESYQARTRVCDLGYLREAYTTVEGKIGFRCASEPIADYVAKGGDVAETVGRKCLCNALMANVGMPQTQKGGEVEQPLLTSGDDMAVIRRVLPEGRTSYTARDVLDYLLSGIAGAR
jgi:NAD(P)H-dependent flavin oxidoreductase YrpB (nitropropane dioxygenase family)